MTDRYVLATGEEGEARLRVVNGVHGPDTERFLQRAGIRPGLRVADIGCGTGNISCWIARQVSPGGEVVGVDVSPEQVEVARKQAERLGIRNASFHAASAYETGLECESCDLVFSRLMLMHLTDSAAAVKEMASLLKPGGILAIEDGDFASPFCEPPSAAFDRTFELYRMVGKSRGHDFHVGPKLYRMVLDCGFRDPQVALAQPIFAKGEEKRLPGWTVEECAGIVEAAGLATAEELRQISAEMRALEQDDSVLFGMARMTQVLARKD